MTNDVFDGQPLEIKVKHLEERATALEKARVRDGESIDGLLERQLGLSRKLEALTRRVDELEALAGRTRVVVSLPEIEGGEVEPHGDEMEQRLADIERRVNLLDANARYEERYRQMCEGLDYPIHAK